MEGGHYASDDIEARVEELFTKWEELLEATDSKRLGLEQALSLVHFNRKVCTYTYASLLTCSYHHVYMLGKVCRIG